MSSPANPVPAPCEHLEELPQPEPGSHGCQSCLASGASWVRLRVCVSCGRVGCCDDSPNRHARAHFTETGHPVVRSFEPGEDWAWCYVDNVSASAADHSISRDSLRRMELFRDLPEADLDALLHIARTVFFAKGEVVVQEGDYGDYMCVVLDGELEVTRRDDQGQDTLVAVLGRGDFMGETALLEASVRTATVRATRDSRLLRLDEGDFFGLLAHSPTATRAVLRAQSARLRSTLAQLQSQQKLATIGELAAHLIHDLNNPSAAIQRSVALLRDTLETLQGAAADIARPVIGDECWQQVEKLTAECRQQLDDGSLPTDALAVADRESDVEGWLDDHSVDKAWEAAPLLVAAGWDLDHMQRLGDAVPAELLDPVVRWLGAHANGDVLLEEVATGARAISGIVRAVKDFSYLDEAPIQNVDLHRSLDDVLVLLKHKLGAVQLVRAYAPDLPQVEAYGPQLGQVWMNVLDNALDAMRESGTGGTLTISTSLQGESAVVTLCDNGPGIPPHLQPRIFDAFFTTKKPGEGSGQGLHNAYTIVVNRHRGQIHVRSKPGETCFEIKLPLHLQRA